jgi:ABC-type uncharacterized transport system substrate-binding protein
VAAKRLELMHKLLPGVGLIAVLVNPTNPVYTAAHVNALEAASRVLGVRLLILNATSQADVEAAFATLVREKAGALIITGDTFFTTHQRQIAALAASHAVPAIEQTREFAAAGGLMSYLSDYADAYHLVGTLVGRILKGEKAADLPVQQPTKVQLIINLKTAKALGLAIPETLLATADEVISSGLRHGHGGHEGYASPRTQHRFDCCAAPSFLAACRGWANSRLTRCEKGRRKLAPRPDATRSHASQAAIGCPYTSSEA